MEQSLAMQTAAGPGAAPNPTRRMEMDQLLAALPDRLREVVVLRYHQELSEKEISEVAGIPRGTVKSRLHAAVGALREALLDRDASADGDTHDG